MSNSLFLKTNMSNININHLNAKASIHNKIKDVMNSSMEIKPSYFFFLEASSLFETAAVALR